MELVECWIVAVKALLASARISVPVVVEVLPKVTAPAELTLKTLEPATWASMRLPVNVLPELIPRPVPLADQPVEVVLAGSIKS